MKILIIAPSWIGDMMMSHSLYRTLNALHPEAKIDVMAPAWSKPVLAKMPEVTQALEIPVGHGVLAIGERRKLGKSLIEAHYDHAYILPNSFKSALIPFFAKIPYRTGWRGEMRYGLLNDLRVLDKQAFPLMVQRYVALAYDKYQVTCAKQLPQPLLKPKLVLMQADINRASLQFNLSAEQQIIAFCPGAEFGPAKRWPHYHYASLAKYLLARHYTVILLGSDKDQLVGQQILAELLPVEQKNCLNLAGKTTLEQAIILLGRSRAVITNDSGLMHIAAALDKPLVALYGPSSPDFTPPLSDKAKVLRLISGYLKIRKGQADQGYHQSLIDLSPQLVITTLEPLLAESVE